MDKIEKQLAVANARLKASNAGIKIFRRGQKLSLRGMLPAKKGKGSSQQTISLGMYCNSAGIQSAEKQAQKLASQLALNEFSWEDWRNQKESVGTFGYWIQEFESDYFARREKNDRSLTTWNTDYRDIYKRVDSTWHLSSEKLIELVLSTEPDSRQRQRATVAAAALANFAKLNLDLSRYKGNYNHLRNGDRVLPTDEEIARYYWSIKNPHWRGRGCAQCRCGATVRCRKHRSFWIDGCLWSKQS